MLNGDKYFESFQCVQKRPSKTNKVEEEVVMELTNTRFFSSSLFFFFHINERELVSYLCIFISFTLEQFSSIFGF
jgi:hypothetical protein